MTTPESGRTSGGHPRPRPALRKAADAHVHPATPPVPAPRSDPAPPPTTRAKGGSKRFSGSTSDTLRVAPGVGDSLMGGKKVDLEVEVPKKLRKAARAEAERRKVPLDDVVAELLQQWLGR